MYGLETKDYFSLIFSCCMMFHVTHLSLKYVFYKSVNPHYVSIMVKKKGNLTDHKSNILSKLYTNYICFKLEKW
jgi:hypothetical protein